MKAFPVFIRRSEPAFARKPNGTRQSAATAPNHQLAFTRAELLVLLAVLTMLAVVILPALANNRPRSGRVICANNLRQIGVGFQLWGNDNDDRQPWEFPVGQGGTQLHSLGGNAWFQFAWISNELNSARILACPSDTGRIADDFSAKPSGGYLNPNYRNNATSYFLTHAWYNGEFALLAGDRNLGNDVPETCSRFVAVSGAGSPPLYTSLVWGTNLHNDAGNIVRIDGRVNQYSTEQIRAAVTADPIVDRDAQRALHLVKPR